MKNMSSLKKKKLKKSPVKTGDNRLKRDENGRFIKGESPNPNGRPLGSGLNLTSLLKAKLEEIPKGKKEAYKILFIRTLLHKALVDKDLQAQKLIMNYVDGLPKQSIEFSGDQDNPIVFMQKEIEKMTDEEVKTEVKGLTSQ